MSASEDIRNLFGKFDGQAQQYQEVSREDQAVQARTRWPLLSSIALDEPGRVPGVGEEGALARAGDATAEDVTLPGSVSGHGSGLAAASAAPVNRPSPSTSGHTAEANEGATRRPSLQSVLFGGAKKHAAAIAATASAPIASRQGAPAFRVQNGPVRPEPVPAAPEEARTEREPPPVVRAGVHARSVPAPSAYPPVVSPETSTLHAPHAQDFAPPVVPVNHFAPDASTLPTAFAAAATPRGFAPSAPAIAAASAAPDNWTLAAAEAPAAARPAPRPSILGRLFAPAAAPAYEATAPTVEPGPAPRDLRSVFSRLSGSNEGTPD